MDNGIVDVRIPENLVPYLYTIKAGKDVSEKLVLNTVIGLFLAKTVTLEKAAELANRSVWDFVELLREQQIPWGEYSEDALRMDDLTLSKVADGSYE